MRKSALFVVLFVAVGLLPGTAFAQSDPEKGSVEGIIGAGYTKANYFTEKARGYDLLLGMRFRVGRSGREI
ncbi:MAG: hypothetical protein AAB897_02765 [Patescibacteria group bacterium]